MVTAREVLIAAIEEQKPLVLILGQSAFGGGGKGSDAVLNQAFDRLERSTESRNGWQTLISASKLLPEFYEWLAGRFEARVPPASLTVIGDLPWSAVFTSSIDPTLPRLFEGGGRSPEVVLTGSEIPRVARSKARPPITYLFGSAGSPHHEERPPANRSALNTRRIQHAVPLLGRILDTATTLGIVVVEGLLAGHDWLTLNDLLGATGNSGPAQVLWFGGRRHLNAVDAEELDAAIESGRILLDEEPLGTAIAELRMRDRLPEPVPLDSEEQGVITVAGADNIETTPDLRLRVEAVASIVDDSWTAFLPPLGSDARYAAFRRFHGNRENARFLVEGIRRDFAITREFESKLYERVRGALRDHASVQLPIVVYGQSATGKSVALARIVARVRQDKLAPVLYSLDRVPQAQEVTKFCELSDKAGSSATLIVCDANRSVDSYYHLLMGLRSRGRRVVVIGSHYRIGDGPNSTKLPGVAAPVTLSDAERKELATLLRKNPDEGWDSGVLQHTNILALLYRLLPSSRRRISAGLTAEVRSIQEELLARGRKVRRSVPNKQMAQQLAKAGVADAYRFLFTDEQNDVLDAQEAAGRIIDLVMVAGSLSCPVPVNFLLRAVTGPFPELDIATVAELFHDLDIFRWRWADGEQSELLVSPRLALEAQIICRRRLGGADAEASLLLDLIGAARNTVVDREYEWRFLLSLLQQIGTDGPRGADYKRAYPEIGRRLTDLRRRFGVYHPSLVLQESAFRRIAVRHGVVEGPERLPLLEEARDALQLALNDIASGKLQAPKRTRRILEVERASVYGFLSIGLAKEGASGSDIWSSYEAARVAIRRAVSVNDNYYPFDVGLWTPGDLLARTELSNLQRGELAADIYTTLAAVSSGMMSPGQREKFEIRKLKVGTALKDYALAEDAYNALEASGSTAGYFLRAREIGPELTVSGEESLAQDDVQRASKAAAFLAGRIKRIDRDDRCLALLLEYRWMAALGRRLLRGSRQPLPASEAVTEDCLAIVRKLNEAAGEAARYVMRYLEAVLTWVSGDEQGGIDLFRGLSHETENDDPSRVVRRHVIADGDGRPVLFNGRIERQRSEGHWVMRMETRNRKVDLLSRDFPDEDIAYGRTIRNFAIAFNYIGPIADPVRPR